MNETTEAEQSINWVTHQKCKDMFILSKVSWLAALLLSCTQCYKKFTAVSYGRKVCCNVIKHVYGRMLRQQSHLAA